MIGRPDDNGEEFHDYPSDAPKWVRMVLDALHAQAADFSVVEVRVQGMNGLERIRMRVRLGRHYADKVWAIETFRQALDARVIVNTDVLGMVDRLRAVHLGVTS